MNVTENNSHDAEALSLLLLQFFNKTKLGQLLSSFVQEVQTIENMLYSLWDERTLETAVGEQLDVYGRVVGQGRSSSIDSDYRKYIKGRVAANKSWGKISELLNILELISDTGDEYILYERPPAAFYIETQTPVVEDSIASFDDATYANASQNRYFDVPALTDNPTPTFVSIAVDLLHDAKGAGIGMDYLWSTRDDTDIFTLSSQSGVIETSSLLGCANSAQSTGGHLQGVIGT